MPSVAQRSGVEARPQLGSTRSIAVAGSATSIDALSGYLVPLGRALFAAIFIMAFLGHLNPATAAYAAAQGVPLASIAVPLSGLIALLGGGSILLGYHAKAGALLIVLFLVPVTFTMHAFWAVADPGAAALEQAAFFKNIALVGAALIIAHVGGGPYSVDAARAERSRVA